MTALQSSFTPSFFGHGPFDTMPDQTSDQSWQHHNQPNQQNNNYIPHMPMLTGQWAPQAQTPSNIQSQQQQHQQQQMLGMPGMDRRFYPENDSTYMSYTSTGASNSLVSPGFAPENTWSDMDIGTPSNFDSPNDPLDSYPQTQATQTRLQPPPRLPSNSKHSHPHAPSLSPHQEAPDPMSVDRPHVGRSQTAPAKAANTKPSKTPTIKAPASDEAESDDDFVPSESNLSSRQPPATSTTSNRGRKRQRIPHTAVERRYRENLNAHLERLRQTVPSLASRRSSSGVVPSLSNSHHTSNNSNIGGGHRASEPGTAPVATLLSDGAKPSKCEILNGAIEHIGAVERENVALREEAKELRARVEDLQRWYSATLRSAGGGVGGVAGVGYAS